MDSDWQFPDGTGKVISISLSRTNTAAQGTDRMSGLQNNSGVALHIAEDLEQLSIMAADRWMNLANESIARSGAFHVALSGGNTPRTLYEQLASPPRCRQIDWNRIHIYMGDERLVPPDHPDSNFRMANETLLSHVPIPDKQIHRIDSGKANAGQCAQAYEELLVESLPTTKDGQKAFDLVLLGIGPDGHIASLFPNTPILDINDRLVAAVFIDRLRSWRVSITFPAINHARHILILASGRNKADIIRQVFTGARRTPCYPVQRLAPEANVEWYLDQPAAGFISILDKE